MLRALFLALSLSVAIPTATMAQVLVPLADVIDRKGMTPYPFIRCAAFFGALVADMISQRLGQATEAKDEISQLFQNDRQTLLAQRYDSLSNDVLILTAVANVLVINQTGVGMQEAGDMVDRDMMNIMTLYRARFEANDALGEAFVGDMLIESDWDLCQDITQVARIAVPGK